MDVRTIAALILSPFVIAFVYAGVHEYLRFKNEGRATYGLVFDEDTGTTHVTSIPEEDAGYDPDDYDPSRYSDPEAADKPDQDRA